MDIPGQKLNGGLQKIPGLRVHKEIKEQEFPFLKRMEQYYLDLPLPGELKYLYSVWALIQRTWVLIWTQPVMSHAELVSDRKV